MKKQERILLNYNAEAHKLAIAKKEEIESSLLDLIKYTTSTTKIEIKDLEAFEADPIEETVRIFWLTFSKGFTAPIDQRKALTLTSYEIPVAQGLYGRYLQLKKENPIVDRERYTTYVNPAKEEFYLQVKELEKMIKNIRDKHPEHKIRTLELVRGFPFFAWLGMDFSIDQSKFV